MPSQYSSVAMLRVFLAFFASFVVISSFASAADPTYWQDVRPVFRKHCIVCHSTRNLPEPEVSAGLALDNYGGVQKGAKRPI
ncbi:MAG TPA: hypothetical protein VGZ47_04955, partial [Gemmataceae bacterium]|nr:hypothetical protein [Gemmataceae bacterium]